MFNNSRQEPLPLTDSFINQDRYTIDDLIEIMAFLRSDRGCPWDREQTHASLRKNLLEEAYEAIDAIDSGIPDKLCEELGDVLLQVVLHAQLATEAEQFDFNDVVQGICRKMISRHTHIFGQDRAASSGEAIDTWEKTSWSRKGTPAKPRYCRMFLECCRRCTVALKFSKRRLESALTGMMPADRWLKSTRSWKRSGRFGPARNKPLQKVKCSRRSLTGRWPVK